MHQTLQQYIQQHHLPLPPQPLVVAISGGADSVALLLLLQDLGYPLHAAHCNFHLRAAESDRDEAFVRQLCDQRGIALSVKHFDTRAFAQNRSISIEMAARELRYQWFETLRQEVGAIAVAVAHHADDNAETLLLNLIRGTGLHGLKGMLPQNGTIIRPLLGMRRKEIETYLNRIGQEFVTDCTNAETVYKRNQIRLEVLPLLQRINPSIHEGLSQTAARLAEAEAIYQKGVETLQQQFVTPQPEGIDLDLAALLQFPSAATLLHETLLPLGFQPAEIQMIFRNLHQQSGATFTGKNHIAVLHKGKLCVRKQPIRFGKWIIPAMMGSFQLPNRKQLILRTMQRKELLEIPKIPDTVALDADRIIGALYCRSIQTGDRFQPFGMRGTQLVSDYLTNRHRSVIEKQNTCVICDDKGILWLMGERPDQRAAITATTQNVLWIHFRQNPLPQE
ncbi:tRNA(Ile)-lysidine synthetase [gut metagenome]|uniref:tRNA(Ile)-lysidine synthetase n=1 Tax=gut metagenome TaxID=749906 RepID=J9G971_9ZZZZ